MSFTTAYPHIKRVDVHTHIGRGNNAAWGDWLRIRTVTQTLCGAEIAAWIDLDGGAILPRWNHRPDDGLQIIAANGGGRILPTLSDYRPAQQLIAATAAQIASRKAQGFCGYKWHWGEDFNGGVNAAHGLLTDAYYAPWLAAMEAAGFPLLCLHLGAPHGNMQAQRNALRTILGRYPNLNVIQAHFGAMQHGTLDDHAALFEQYPNFYRDISTTAQNMPTWRPAPSVAECRQFFEAYSHRLLWGTDNMAGVNDTVRTTFMATKSALQFEYWETTNQVPTAGIGATKPTTPTHVAGMGLSERALKRIYWENAIRLIPHLREKLIALGYTVPGTGPTPDPDPDPVEPTPMLAPNNLRFNTAQTRLLWDYTAVSSLTGFRLRIPSLTGGSPTTRDLDRSARRIDIADLSLAPGTYVIEIRALGSDGNSGFAAFPSLTIAEPPAATQVCADYTTGTPRADWTVNLGSIDSIRAKIDGIEMIQGGPTSITAPLPALANGAHTLKIEAVSGGAVGASVEVNFSTPSAARTCSGTAPGAGVFRADHASGKIKDPAGNDIKLCGFRVPRAVTQRPNVTGVEKITADQLAVWTGQTGGSVAGNAQALEIWWSSSVDFGVGEPDPTVVGNPATGAGYLSAGIPYLKERIKTLKAAGIYSIPSIRVSYDDVDAVPNGLGRTGQMTPQGWALHSAVVNNADVVVPAGSKAGTYGKARDRFFAWLDWFIPKLIKKADGTIDTDITSAIAYWEMWHYCGHKQGFPIDKYLDEFVPLLTAKYRSHLPSAMLGAGLVADVAVERLLDRLNGTVTGMPWTPWHRCAGNPNGDPNLIYVIGGYGVLRATRRYNETTFGYEGARVYFPQDSVNPTFHGNASTGKFNIEWLQEEFRKPARNWGCTMHQQEGPGQMNWYKRNPMPPQPREWTVGMLNLFNRVTNGFAIHQWPPLQTDYVESSNNGFYTRKPNSSQLNGWGAYSEADWKAIIQRAMTGSTNVGG